MCGIAGVLNFNGEPASPLLLKRMTDAISHRGPDGEGHYIDEALGLGHRRLAIIDLSAAGHQPMATTNGRFVISYNGEVYNFKELQIELEAEGNRFHSRTDSEVVLKALAQWGTDALTRFNGMFALALWDTERKELLLARDRHGIKPLYYAQVGNRLLFGSEVKAILADPSYRTEMDHDGLLEYLTFQNFFTDRTLFKNVHLLPQGSFLRISAERGIRTPTRYWDYMFEEPKSSADEQEYVEELDRLFQQAVSRQLISDVDVGAYLSGGMDSGAVTALAARELPYIKSFTNCYRKLSFIIAMI